MLYENNQDTTDIKSKFLYDFDRPARAATSTSTSATATQPTPATATTAPETGHSVETGIQTSNAADTVGTTQDVNGTAAAHGQSYNESVMDSASTATSTNVYGNEAVEMSGGGDDMGFLNGVTQAEMEDEHTHSPGSIVERQMNGAGAGVDDTEMERTG